MYNITQTVMEKTEALILNLPSESKLWSTATRLFIFPFKYLLLGLGEFFRPASIWAYVAFALLIISSFMINNLNIQREYTTLIFSICIYLPMVLVIFAVPSTYAYYGVQDYHVKKIVEVLEQLEVNSIEKIELLEENIEKIYSRILSRITFYKWLVGSIWALFIIITNIEIRILLKVQNEGWQQAIGDNIIYFSIFLFATLFALLLIVGYKRASELLIKSIEFSCVEKKYLLQTDTLNEKKPNQNFSLHRRSR
ncbi:MAG: hypothetical protein OQL19_20665 [Gammaproteobacteria bacterium]|nr:hypothetical protein [Gammaproteobacteria bacterium]